MNVPEPNNFLCPKCKKSLVVNHSVVIAAKGKNEAAGLIQLSPELGDYSITFQDDFVASTGDLLQLFCPVCHQDLASSKHINLAMLVAIDKDKKEFEIFFSRIVGEHSTVKIIGDNTEVYGEDVYKYQDFFNKPRQMF